MIRILADSSDDAKLIEEAVGRSAQVYWSGGIADRDAQVECVILGVRSPVPPG